MERILNLLNDFSYLTIIFRILLSAILGGLIGSERGKRGNAAGLRTHILVCIGSAITALTGIFSVEILGYTGDPFRISAQVMSGIGFLGAGIILVKDNSVVRGLTTAAGMWTTAAIGIAVGYGFYLGAIVSFVVYIFSVTFLSRFEKKRKSQKCFYIEISNLGSVGLVAETIREAWPASLNIIPAKSGNTGNVGMVVLTTAAFNSNDFKQSINDIGGVLFVLEED